jgi:hypothetical protein
MLADMPRIAERQCTKAFIFAVELLPELLTSLLFASGKVIEPSFHFAVLICAKTTLDCLGNASRHR